MRQASRQKIGASAEAPIFLNHPSILRDFTGKSGHLSYIRSKDLISAGASDDTLFHSRPFADRRRRERQRGA
ncbi:hypothetical protein AGR9A_Lc40703 [Agrobacterium salinitolerans str. Hayward 0363]|nr:hypothetical protein AGR9A_Lc40703 [Agrobacterium salinitolerans str. Hayward 0363]